MNKSCIQNNRFADLSLADSADCRRKLSTTILLTLSVYLRNQREINTYLKITDA